MAQSPSLTKAIRMLQQMHGVKNEKSVSGRLPVIMHLTPEDIEAINEELLASGVTFEQFMSHGMGLALEHYKLARRHGTLIAREVDDSEEPWGF